MRRRIVPKAEKEKPNEETTSPFSTIAFRLVAHGAAPLTLHPPATGLNAGSTEIDIIIGATTADIVQASHCIWAAPAEAIVTATIATGKNTSRFSGASF